MQSLGSGGKFNPRNHFQGQEEQENPQAQVHQKEVMPNQPDKLLLSNHQPG